MRRALLFLAIVAIGLTSCGDFGDLLGGNNPEEPIVGTIEVEPSSLTFPAEGGEEELTVVSNVDYELYCNVDWITCEKSKNGAVVVVEGHFANTKRKAMVVVANKEFGIYKSVIIEQESYMSTSPSSATLEKNVIAWDEVAVKGATFGDANYSYEVQVLQGGDFCSVIYPTGKVGEEFILSFTKNMTDAERVVEIGVVFSDGYYKKFVVRQLAEKQDVQADISYNRLWAEQPAKNENRHYIHKTYYSTLSDNRRVRNFSVCYDTVKMCSRWVAYPAHSVYRKWGSYQVGENNNKGRTNAWAFDDAVTQYAPSEDYNCAYSIVSNYDSRTDAYDTATEPIIPHRRQADICFTNAFGWGWARGHMLPSSQRYNTWQNNAQTCYATNIMVQQYDFNGGSWADTEALERGKNCSDTLYVVVGTLFEDNTTITRFGRTIGVPTHCYKLMLRTRSGSTGKAISNITSASDIICIGFLYENSAESANATVASAAVSVADVEKRSGFKFFQNLNPEIADKVKSQKSLSDWGL